MSSSSAPSPPEESMKALMEAVAQVSSLPAFHFYPQPATSVLHFPGAPGSNGFLPAAISISTGGHSTTQHQQPPAAAGPAHMNIGGMLTNGHGGPLRKRNHGSMLDCGSVVAAAKKASAKTDVGVGARKLQRLEHNRLAAIESRRRKKHMVEELQRSVQFYTKANSNVKSQNAELERQLLIAKQKILRNDQSKAAETKKVAEVAAPVSSVKASLPSPSLKQSPVPRMSSTKATVSYQPAKQPTKMPAISHASRSTIPRTYGNSASVEMERQAQQAQFAATQALYKTMGYPAGAARVAANTFSQFVGQTGIVPGFNDVNSKVTTHPPKEAIKTPTPVPVISSPLAPDNSKSSSAESEYIEALNRFAMQQAAAANAAAAAATAAIQAAHLHNQLKNNASSSSDTKALPSMPLFTFPGAAAMTSWPFQPQAAIMKKGE